MHNKFPFDGSICFLPPVFLFLLLLILLLSLLRRCVGIHFSLQNVVSTIQKITKKRINSLRKKREKLCATKAVGDEEEDDVSPRKKRPTKEKHEGNCIADNRRDVCLYIIISQGMRQTRGDAENEEIAQDDADVARLVFGSNQKRRNSPIDTTTRGRTTTTTVR